MVREGLVQEILALGVAEREYLRDVVLASLSEDLPPRLSPEDQAEILRRLDVYDRSPESFISWDEMKQKLRLRRLGN